MSITEELVAFAWGRPLAPDAVRHTVRRHVLDAIGNALAGARTGVVAPVVEVARGLGGPGQAHVLAGGAPIGAPAAALANGALVHGLDFDDTHAGALVHPTAVLLPAALAVAEEHDADGAELLDALVPAYEAVLRIGSAAPHGFHARGFHATSVVGVFGAAMVASRLAGLSQGAAVNALGIAGSQAAGSLEFLAEGVTTKQLHPGLAAMNGVLAARLAGAGATGPRTILEGRAGLYSTHAALDVPVGDVVEGLGQGWQTTRITVKPYPVCQLSHAALDALASLRERLDVDRVRRIEVRLPRESMEIVADPAARKRRPGSTYEARFSLQFCLAVLLREGHLTVDDLGADQLDDDQLRRLADLVEVRPFDADGVAAAAPGHVRVVLDDGTEMVGEVATSRGGPDNPLDDQQLARKFRDNVGPAVGERAVRLVDTLLGLDATTSVRALVQDVVALGTGQTTPTRG